MSKILFNMSGAFFHRLARRRAHCGDIEKAENFLSKALYFFDRSKNAAKGFSALVDIGTLYRYSCNFEIAESIYQEALEFAYKYHDKHNAAVALLNLGMLSFAKDDYGKALHFYGLGFDELREEKEYFLKGALAYNTAVALHLEDKPCLDEFYRAADFYDQAGVVASQALAYHSMGEVCMHGGDETGAVRAWCKSKELYERAPFNEQGELADVLLDLGMALEDDAMLEKAYKLNRSAGRRMQAAMCLSAMGLRSMGYGDYEKAGIFLKKALKEDEDLGYVSALVPDYANLALLEHKKGNEEKKLEYFRKAENYAAALGNRQVITELTRLFYIDGNGH